MKSLLANFCLVHFLFRRVTLLSYILYNASFKEYQGSNQDFMLNVRHHFLVCVDNVNLLGENMNTVKKSAEALLDGH